MNRMQCYQCGVVQGRGRRVITVLCPKCAEENRLYTLAQLAKARAQDQAKVVDVMIPALSAERTEPDDLPCAECGTLTSHTTTQHEEAMVDTAKGETA